ncbi:MAG: ribosome biogenesis GTPase YlqF [Oscillospiraceae bacterium]|nr:ribosome biogenesis GTPase YlqF [Oscillospiraceae bacterium]
MNIHWYPGHMAKTMRLMAEHLKLVDAVCVLLDARIPASSGNPELDGLANRKPVLYVLTREDLADPAATSRWIEKLRREKPGSGAVSVNAKSGAGVERVSAAARALLSEKLAARAAKGRETGAIRLMVTGIPNVGKSSLINRLSRRKPAKTEDRPGVTRGMQWIEAGGGLMLLDVPGVLPPKLKDERRALHLAYTGAVKDQILDIETLAMSLCETLRDAAPEAFKSRCKWDAFPGGGGYELLSAAALSRGCLKRGGEPDTERMARLLLDEFRGGILGRITLDLPD